MNHCGGLAALDHAFDLKDFLDNDKQEEVSSILARQTPDPAIKQGYHMVTYGMYVMEIYKRLTDQPFSDFFREHIAGPVDANVWVGAPDSVDDSVVEIEEPGTLTRLTGMVSAILRGGSTEATLGRSLFKSGSVSRRVLVNSTLGQKGVEAYNQPEVRRKSLLWGSGVGSARGLAKIYGVLANGGVTDNGTRVFKTETIEPVTKRQLWLGIPDLVLGKPASWAQGFLKEEDGLFSPGEAGFGHSGLGGALGWADPDRNLGFGYVNNCLDWRVRSPRCLRLCKATYASAALSKVST